MLRLTILGDIIKSSDYFTKYNKLRIKRERSSEAILYNFYRK